jgi:uncharacterized damage-inducible protein DinB
MMISSTSPSLKQLVLGDLDHELATTRRVLERVPEGHFPWKPHERSMSLGQLASHTANLLHWQAVILRQEEFDLATATPPSKEGLTSRDELLRTFDELAAEVKDALGSADEAALTRAWILRRGDQVLLSQPRAAILRSMGLSHMIHHRGQLCLYLRLLNVPVPSVYGPSADEGASWSPRGADASPA